MCSKTTRLCPSTDGVDVRDYCFRVDYWCDVSVGQNGSVTRLFGWAAVDIASLSLVEVVGYVFGIPILVYRIAKRFFYRGKDDVVGVWFGAVLVGTWLSAFAVMIVLFALYH